VFFDQFKNSVVLEVAYVYHNQLLFYNFLKKLSTRTSALKIEYIHSRVKVLGWPTK
jgi:hypothetical protein